VTLPHAETDATLAFLREGYDYVSNRCRRLGADAFRTRLMLRPVVCLRGAEAARLFYDGDRFTRRGAMAESVVRLLQDHGSVQSLDGEAHRVRKAMFVALLTPAAARAELAGCFEQVWAEARPRWGQTRQIALLPEMSSMLARAACRWTGLPFAAAGGEALTRELDAMVANAGRIGPRNWHASLRRRRTERRLAELVRLIRGGSLALPREAPARRVAEHRDADGELLSPEIAAVELLNLLRPIVAVGRFIVFAAIELDRRPEWREHFAKGDESLLEPFVEEVRRRSPFFPLVGGRARRRIAWEGHVFEPGDWALLDLYGTNRDPRSFPEPDALRPDRAASWRDQNHAFVPQGAGDARVTHRCPGEGATVELMKSAVRLLSGMDWAVADPRMRLSGGFPPQPRDGLAIFVAPMPETEARDRPQGQFRHLARNVR
jgi:fatty-acid peroxygenase